MTVPLVAPAIGGGGVSTISSAAGRKASSSLRVDGLYRRETAALERLSISPAMARGGRIFRKCATKSPCGRPREPLETAPSGEALADFLAPCRQTVQRRIAAASPEQVIMGAVLRQTAAVDRDEAVASPHRGQPMRNDEDRAALGNPRHVLLDDALAFIVECARRLVEDQDA